MNRLQLDIVILPGLAAIGSAAAMPSISVSFPPWVCATLGLIGVGCNAALIALRGFQDKEPKP